MKLIRYTSFISLIVGSNPDSYGLEHWGDKKSSKEEQAQHFIPLNCFRPCSLLHNSAFRPVFLRLAIDIHDGLHIYPSASTAPKQDGTLGPVDLPRESVTLQFQIRGLEWPRRPRQQIGQIELWERSFKWREAVECNDCLSNLSFWLCGQLISRYCTSAKRHAPGPCQYVGSPFPVPVLRPHSVSENTPQTAYIHDLCQGW